MSVMQNSVSSRPISVQADLSQRLVLYRFDFLQKFWALPARAIQSDTDLFFPADPAALTSAISQNLPDFSGHSLGGCKPLKAVTVVALAFASLVGQVIYWRNHLIKF